MSKNKGVRARTKYKLTFRGKVNLFFRRTWVIKILWPYRRLVSIFAFTVIRKSKEWNQDFYDKNIKLLYSVVRKKEAVELVTKIVDTRKGGKHLKLLIIEAPDNTIEIALREEDYPQIYNTSKKAQSKRITSIQL